MSECSSNTHTPWALKKTTRVSWGFPSWSRLVLAWRLNPTPPPHTSDSAYRNKTKRHPIILTNIRNFKLSSKYKRSRLTFLQKCFKAFLVSQGYQYTYSSNKRTFIWMGPSVIELRLGFSTFHLTLFGNWIRFIHSWFWSHHNHFSCCLWKIS